MTILAEHLNPQRSEVSVPAPFVLYWRFRPNHPWTIERFRERPKAHNRFFNLLERGIEARFEAAADGTRPVRRSLRSSQYGASAMPPAGVN